MTRHAHAQPDRYTRNSVAYEHSRISSESDPFALKMPFEKVGEHGPPIDRGQPIQIMRFQMIWQNETTGETKLVASGEFLHNKALHEWTAQVAQQKDHLRPVGWRWVCCDDSSPLYVREKKLVH